MSRLRFAVLAPLLALALAPAPARAEDACLDDARRLCSSVPPGSGRVYYCLRSSWNDLSDGCKALLNWSQQRANEVVLDCQADAFSWCQGVPPGKARLYACLVAHHKDLSSTCRKGLQEVEWFNSACGADRERLCSGVPVADGGAIACLVTRRDELSPACQAVFWPPQ